MILSIILAAVWVRMLLKLVTNSQLTLCLYHAYIKETLPCIILNCLENISDISTEGGPWTPTS